MFYQFFYTLKEVGIPVSPTSFLILQKALDQGLISSVEDLYVAARAVLVKSEKYFDLYDQVFAAIFKGAQLPDSGDEEIDLAAMAMLDEWLKNPKELARQLGEDEKTLSRLSPEELLDYFKKRLQDQKGRHDGGSRWIGTGGTSPVGHSGHHPGGMRVGGVSGGKTALKVASERRYRNYSVNAPLTQATMGEALKRLRNLVPQGARDRIDVEASIYQTMKNGGEIELVFARSIVDRLKVILLIDNGGWSMEPHVEVVQTLFSYAVSQFKDITTYFFHNTIYDLVWEDASRYRKPVPVDRLVSRDAESRLIIVGDASMAPYELMAADGSIHAFERSGRPSVERLRLLAETFSHSVWLNPVPERNWDYTHTITAIRSIFPMFELSLDGLEKAVSHLLQK